MLQWSGGFNGFVNIIVKIVDFMQFFTVIEIFTQLGRPSYALGFGQASIFTDGGVETTPTEDCRCGDDEIRTHEGF